MRCNYNENHILIIPLYLLPVTHTSMTPSPPQNSPSAPGQAEAHKPLSTYVVIMLWNYILGRLSFERASKVSVKWLKHLHLLSRSRIKAWSSPTLNPVAKQWWMCQKGSTTSTSGSHLFISPEYLVDGPSEFARLRARQFVALLFPSKVTLGTKVLINR